MFNHASDKYVCPICCAIEEIESETTWIKQDDIFYRDDLVMGFISSKAIKGNEGHPLIVPLKHFENIYDLPKAQAHRIIDVAQRVAVALKKTRDCDGITFVQNNEPAGDQHAFHYHLHIIPRFMNDHFSKELWKAEQSNPKDRVDFSTALRRALS
ncbi:MAG: HIT domain-containing protein [Methylococcaceae bacterium]